MNNDMAMNSGAAAGFAAVGMIFMLIELAIVAFAVVSIWKVFSKAGQPGWAILIPIYGPIILCKIAGRPWWWIFLLWLPIVQIDLAKSFGKGAGFGIGLWLLGIVFYPILAFGSATYQGTGGAMQPAMG